MRLKNYILVFLSVFLINRCSDTQREGRYINVSGIYPHLACYNNEGECGTGAVVPWAGRLWVITYGPHLPFGSSDKLYEITPALNRIVREESIGGTPANRMIHRESKLLFIGPYAIDEDRNIRVIPYSKMPGRHTGNARHLFYPHEKIYYATMEEGFYEVDVNTLEMNTLFEDGNLRKEDRNKDKDINQKYSALPGAHGKGLYSGQGVLVFSNNGEATAKAMEEFDIMAGVLAEWDGNNWDVIRRNQFVEVTGPGGLYGNPEPEKDPIWATGWDHKSVILGVRSPGGWSFYRLPKTSHSYDGAHGWNTEWPRIRDIGTPDNPDYLMTMHGMFWRFPAYFTKDNTVGIRPRSAYLKVIGDFARWNGRLVFGCDDSAQKEFLNKRKAKGNIEGPGQSNSNLWFTSPDQPDMLGPTTTEGAVWLSEEIKENEYSEPMLFAGWPKRIAWVYQEGKGENVFIFETDKAGNGNWSKLKEITINGNQTAYIEFPKADPGEWIRVKAKRPAVATVHFFYTDNDERNAASDPIFAGLADLQSLNVVGGLLYGLGNNRRSLGVLVSGFNNASVSETGYYELDSAMNLVKKDDKETADYIRQRFAIPHDVITIDDASVLIIDDKGRRWRLPLGDKKFTELTKESQLRICREVATERDLFNCHGTFYELPAENADGYAKIRPVASHHFRIHDYASYRGLLVMTGIEKDALPDNEHIFVSKDGKARLWAGVIDDLWKLGKPKGRGGPWKNSFVKADEPSDPYLIGFYDKKYLKISHDGDEPVLVKIQAEPIGHGPWMNYMEVMVKAGETYHYIFPEAFQARWIRFVANKDCKATAWLVYE